MFSYYVSCPYLYSRQQSTLLLPLSVLTKDILLSPACIYVFMYVCAHISSKAVSFLLCQPPWHSGVPGEETGSGFECISNNNCRDYLFIILIILVTCIVFSKQPFVCKEMEVTRQLRTMEDGIRSSLVLVKNQNEASAHETDQPQVWCVFVTTELETFFKQFIPT